MLHRLSILLILLGVNLLLSFVCFCLIDFVLNGNPTKFAGTLCFVVYFMILAPTVVGWWYFFKECLALIVDRIKVIREIKDIKMSKTEKTIIYLLLVIFTAGFLSYLNYVKDNDRYSLEPVIVENTTGLLLLFDKRTGKIISKGRFPEFTLEELKN